MTKFQKKNFIIGGLLALVIVMGYAYSMFSTNLNITGTGSTNNNWDIEIVSITPNRTVSNTGTEADPTYEHSGSISSEVGSDKISATFLAALVNPGDTVSYDIVIENKGSIDARLNEIIKRINTNSNAIKVNFTGYTKGERLYKRGEEGSTKTITVNITYDSNAEGNPGESTEITLEFDYSQATGNNGSIDNPEPSSYLLTYDYITNGGKTSENTEEYVEENEEIRLSRTAEKEGYTFVGWNTNKDATTALETLTMGANNVTLYAIFKKEAITYRASFNSNGATLSSTNEKTCTIPAVYNNQVQDTSCTLDAPTITRSGYTIIGYNDSSNATTNNNSYNTSTGKLTLTSTNNNKTWYAITKKDITITFLKGTNTASVGKASEECTIQNTATNCTVTTPSITPNSEYVPAGWSTTNGATTGTTSGDNITVTDNTTYYGNSKADEVTLSIATASTTSTITITATASATSVIKNYIYTIDGSAATCKSGTASNICIIENLAHNKAYTVGATITANSNKTSTTSKSASTVKIDTPTYSSNKNVTTITYPSDCTNYICEYSIDGESSWTTVITNTKEVTFDKAGTLIARVTDKTNSSNVVTASKCTFAPKAENLSYVDTNTTFGCSDVQCALEKIKEMLE